MTGVSLEYRFDDRDVLAMLSRLDDFQKHHLLEEIGGYLDTETARRFDEQVDWQGNSLEPSQRAERDGGKTLMDHLHLMQSYHAEILSDDSGVEFGSNMIYAAIHQFGGNAGRNLAVEIDARPILGINADDELEINYIVEDFLRDVLK